MSLTTTTTDLGEFREAADLHQAILSARERVLGPDHPDTLRSRNNLALAEAALARSRWRFPRRRPQADSLAPPTDPARTNPPTAS